jgi:hypothetical protein
MNHELESPYLLGRGVCQSRLLFYEVHPRNPEGPARGHRCPIETGFFIVHLPDKCCKSLLGQYSPNPTKMVDTLIAVALDLINR